jgi:Zn-finger nucleic acid-binding protein
VTSPTGDKDQPEAARSCPRCPESTLTPDVGALGEAVCPSCRGRLLSPEAVDVLVVRQLGHSPAFLQELAEHFHSRGVRCPACGADMALLELRGCAIDLCVKCGHAWLDEGELSRLSGGRYEEPAPPTLPSPSSSAASKPPQPAGRPSRSWPVTVAIAIAVVALLVLGIVRHRSNADLDRAAAELRAARPEASATARQSRARGKGDGVAALEARCAADDREACVKLVDEHYWKGDARDPEAAARIFDKLCALGSLVACSNLGFLNETGQGVPQDLRRALSLYESACTASTARSCRQAARLLATGRGVTKDLHEARRLYEMACDNDDRAACTELERLEND